MWLSYLAVQFDSKLERSLSTLFAKAKPVDGELEGPVSLIIHSTCTYLHCLWLLLPDQSYAGSIREND